MDRWEEVKASIKRLEEDPSVNQELLRAMDHISLADYWKRRSEEEHSLLNALRHHVDGQDAELRQAELRAQMTERSYEDKRRLWEQERDTLEEKLKVKETEIKLLRERSEWESRFQETVKNLKGSGGRSGIRIPGEDDGAEFFDHQIKRFAKDIEAVRDSTEEISARTRWLDKQKEKVLEFFEGKGGSQASSPDMGRIKDLIEKMSGQVNSLQESLAQKNGSFLAASSQPLNNAVLPAGDALVMVGSANPPTSGANAEAVNKWNENLQLFQLIQEDVARGFCHKARNLLGIISGTAQIVLSDEKLAPDMKENLTTIDENVTLLLESIEEFLALTRVPQLTYEEVDLNQLIQEIAASTGIQVSLGQGVPKIHIDRKVIKDGIGFALDNARESGGASGIVVSTRFDQVSSGVFIDIRDTGAGIGENHIKKVFQPYFTTKKDKRGLGLSKTLRSATLHGGKVTVDSAKGAGTTIHIWLPVA